MHSFSLCASAPLKITVASIALLLAHASGCSQGPDRVAAPDWDPSEIAAAALEQLDKNGDEQLDAAELVEAPGLAAGVRFVDRDGDAMVTPAELEARFETFRQQKTGLRSPRFRVTYHGRPVVNADVAFLPEKFLADVIEPAHGVTDSDGVVAPATDGQPLPGVRLGHYRVQIKSSTGGLPARYAESGTPLGADVSLAEDGASYGVVELRITD